MTDTADHRKHSPSSRGSTSASARDGTRDACGTSTSTTARCGRPDESGDVRVEVEVPGEPAGLGWLPDGRLLVVARKPRTVLRLEADGSLVEHGDLNPTAGFYGNDMVVDSAGGPMWELRVRPRRLHRGTRARRRWWNRPGPPTTALIRIDPDGSAHVAAEDMSFPNGTVITPDGQDHDRGRDAGRPAHRLRRGRRRRAQRAPGVGRRSSGARPTGSASTPTATCGWPTPSPTSACWWPRAARSSTGSPPPSTASPACSGATTGAPST